MQSLSYILIWVGTTATLYWLSFQIEAMIRNFF
jgi:hypothetical protein